MVEREIQNAVLLHAISNRSIFLKAIFYCGRFARAGGAYIVFETRHVRLSRFSKVAPPARAKRAQWKIALTTRFCKLGNARARAGSMPAYFYKNTKSK